MRTHLLALTATLALKAATASGQLTWGVNGAGGTGTWNASSLNWWNGTSNVAWVSGGEGIFAGTAGTVTIGESVTASKLTFNVPGYILQQNSLNGSVAGLTIEANAEATINSPVLGASSVGDTFSKTGTAALTVTGSFVFFDQVSIQAGELKFTNSARGSASTLYSLADTPGAVMTLGFISSSAFSAGGLSGGGVNGGIVRPANLPGTQTLAVFSSGGIFAGSLQNNGVGILALSSSGSQGLTGANTYSGATVVNGGTLTLSQGGSALNSPFQIAGGTLQLDNFDVQVVNRISDTLPITITGQLSLRGNAFAPSIETLGPLTLGGTRGTISIAPDPAQSAGVVFDSLVPRTVSRSGILYFEGPGLGSAVGPGVASVRFTNAPPLIGGSGSGGSSTLSILPAVLGVTPFGTTFLTYGPDGLRPLADTEYSGDLFASGALGNVSLNTVVNLSSSAAINSLRLTAGGAVSGNGALAIGSGMILARAGTGPLTVGAMAFGNGEAVITNESDLTISSAILGSSTGNGLTKNGAGRLILTGNSKYTGATIVAEGVLAIANQSALGDAIGVVAVQSGATLELPGGIAVASKPLTLLGGGPRGAASLRSLSGTNVWNGSALLQSASINVKAGSLSFGGATTLTGPLTKTGAGALVFGNALGQGSDDLAILEGSVVSKATAGIAFGRRSIALYDASVGYAPSGSGLDVVVSDGALNTATGVGTFFSFNQGNSTLVLDKDANRTLTVTMGISSRPSGVFRRGEKATLVIAPSGGMSALGVSERMKDASVLGTLDFLTNGIFSPAMIGQDNDANRSGDFLAYDTTAGLRKATYSTLTSLPINGFSLVFNATSPQTLTANAAVYALKNSGQTITLNGRFLSLGGSRWQRSLSQKSCWLDYERRLHHGRDDRDFANSLQRERSDDLHESCGRSHHEQFRWKVIRVGGPHQIRSRFIKSNRQRCGFPDRKQRRRPSRWRGGRHGDAFWRCHAFRHRPDRRDQGRSHLAR